MLKIKHILRDRQTDIYRERHTHTESNLMLKIKNKPKEKGSYAEDKAPTLLQKSNCYVAKCKNDLSLFLGS